MKKKDKLFKLLFTLFGVVFSITLVLSMPILIKSLTNNAVVTNAAYVGDDTQLDSDFYVTSDVLKLTASVDYNNVNDISLSAGVNDFNFLDTEFASSFEDSDKRVYFSTSGLTDTAWRSYRIITSQNNINNFYPSRMCWVLGNSLYALDLSNTVTNQNQLIYRFIAQDFYCRNDILNLLTFGLGLDSDLGRFSYELTYNYNYFDINYEYNTELVTLIGNDVKTINLFDSSTFNDYSHNYSYITNFNLVIYDIYNNNDATAGLSQYTELRFSSYGYRAGPNTKSLSLLFHESQIDNYKNIYAFDFGQWLTSATYGFFNLEIYPGFTIFMIVSTFLALAIVLAFLKVFAGG